MQQEPCPTMLFRSAQYFQELSPSLYKLNLHQIVKEVCDLMLLTSIEEVAAWVASCTHLIKECETTYDLFLCHAMKVKMLLSPEHVPPILAHIQEFRPNIVFPRDLIIVINTTPLRILNRLVNILRIKLTATDLANYNWVVDELTNPAGAQTDDQPLKKKQGNSQSQVG